MQQYVDWLKALPGRPVFVAYPAGFDFLFVYWYLIRFAGESPFSHSALDMKTYAMAVLRKRVPRRRPSATCPARWFDDAAAHARGAGRCDRAGGAVLQHAQGPAGAALRVSTVTSGGVPMRKGMPQ